MKAVVLLSGGIDSTVSAYIAKNQGREIHALTLSYGQRHSYEIESAKKIGNILGVQEHKIIDLDLNLFGGSALTDEIQLPINRSFEEIDSGEIPSTYVPARNTILLSIALAYAETRNCGEIYIGAHCMDYSGYPDCRPEYIQKFQEMADLATKKAVQGDTIKIMTPLIELDKTQILQKGLELDVPFEFTRSCYSGGKKPCGKCDSCRLRLKGFEKLGLADPVEYEK